MIQVELNVLGLPSSQGSHFGVVRNNRVQILPVQGAKLDAWRGSVTRSAREWMAANDYEESPWSKSTPLSVAIVFRLPQPKQTPKQLLHERRPDVCKLVRSTLDGLQKADIICDDSRIAIVIAAKRWNHSDPPGAEIVIREALDEDLEEVFACWAS